MTIKKLVDASGLSEVWAKIKEKVYTKTEVDAKPTILLGTSTPTAADGKNGDIYVVYEEE